MDWLRKRSDKPDGAAPARKAFRAVVGKPHEYYRDFVKDGSLRQPREALIARTTPVHAMGSCFANEVSNYLFQNGIGVLSPTIPEEAHPLFDEASREVSSWGAWDGRSNLQYYNTFSIRQEVEKAAGLWTQDPEDFWRVKVRGDKLVQCPYRRRIFCRSVEDLHAVTAVIDQRIRTGLENAEVVIFTLGLTEVWRKKDDGRIACCEPGYCRGGGHDETEFVASTYEQNYDNVASTVRLVREHFGARKVVVTVSPVALGRTFRPMAINLANMESKSILRTVAGRVAAELEDVVYFPSYELCALDPDSFMPDGRHVRPEKIAQIMDFFVQCHGPK